MLKVSNLPTSTTESDLRELFSDYGEFEILFFMDGGNWAAVSLGNNEYEKDAIEKLNGTLWGDNYISIEIEEEVELYEQSDERNTLDVKRRKP